MSRVFLDTVGIIALLDEADQWHDRADEACGRLRANNARLCTSSYVLLECGNAAARRPYRGAVADLARQLSERGELVHPVDSEWLAAWHVYEIAHAGGPSIVDCVSFEVMSLL